MMTPSEIVAPPFALGSASSSVPSSERGGWSTRHRFLCASLMLLVALGLMQLVFIGGAGQAALLPFTPAGVPASTDREEPRSPLAGERSYTEPGVQRRATPPLTAPLPPQRPVRV